MDEKELTQPCPRARALSPIPIEIEGQQLIVLRDPLQFSPEVVVPPVVYFFLMSLDGQNSLRDIKLFFARQFQHILTDEESAHILAELDRHFLLDTERFRAHRDEVVRAYHSETVRQPSHQGSAYPDDADVLAAQLDSFYCYPDGPGQPPSALTAGERRVRALIAPHISIHQGGPCFAWAYSRLCQSAPIETFVILGTGHADIPGCFAATRKTFLTPFGPVPVDLEFLDRLEQYDGSDLCREEIYHRAEHVIEFQTLFLQHALNGRDGQPPYRIVPILCSFLPDAWSPEEPNPEVIESVERFCQALRRTLAETTRPVCVICSADLAHIGYRYGDPVRIGRAHIDCMERDDYAMLKIIQSGDAEGFVANLLRDGNRRHICGFPCIYTMLRAMDLTGGELLRYNYSAMDDHNSTVSYASMVFY
ncbi:MAG: AmmeMemoRadiSam system protein B [Candidatus Sumerlaeia bacterium]|nr:AmmeMemoRadiSam system protein B [Candidatus Sumerlaeia bacterium]